LAELALETAGDAETSMIFHLIELPGHGANMEQ
jgi:hypothetical protein